MQDTVPDDGGIGLSAKLVKILSLRFPDEEEESRFLQLFVADYRRFHQAALAQGAILFYVFFLWDRIIDPLHYELTQLIRGGIFSTSSILAIGLLQLDAKSKHHEWLLTGLCVMANILLTIIYSILTNGMKFGAVGLVLVTLFTFTLLHMRFRFFVMYCTISLVVFNVGHWVTNTDTGTTAINNLSLATATFLGLFAAFHREHEARQRFRLEQELRAAKQQVEELLYSMLPNDIVRRISLGEKVIADSYGEVSIVFADLVGFTQLARKLAPNHLVELLNKLFSEFDSLAKQYDVEKIKTIGDAYMAISGVGDKSEGQAMRAADFSISIRDAVAKLSQENHLNMQIRIGLHIGPVVAGVIGNTRPAYDCWGDSVNIASRLESSALNGSIHISEQAYWRLRDEFKVEKTQEEERKGLGSAATYTLIGRRSVN